MLASVVHKSKAEGPRAVSLAPASPRESIHKLFKLMALNAYANDLLNAPLETSYEYPKVYKTRPSSYL